MSWHIQDPEQFEREKSEMLKRHPGFSLPALDSAPWEGGLRVVAWAGEARLFDPEGGLLKSLGVKIYCPPNYPQTIPVVYDNPRELTPDMCHQHMYSNGSLCYGLREREEKLQPDKISVATVVDFVSHFTANLWCYENGMGWPHEYLHRDLDFLDREINGERIIRHAECPCGKTKNYRHCHFEVVKALLRRIAAAIPSKVEHRDRFCRPTAKCPCGSGKAYNRCCSTKHGAENLSRFPLFMLLKYPELNPCKAWEILNHFEGNDDELAKLVKRSPIARINPLPPDGRR